MRFLFGLVLTGSIMGYLMDSLPNASNTLRAGIGTAGNALHSLAASGAGDHAISTAGTILQAFAASNDPISSLTTKGLNNG